MARVSASEVKLIMDNCTVADAVVTSMIDTASLLIDDLFSSTSLSTSQLTNLEKYLSAHIVASTVSRTTSEEKLGDASVVFTGKWGEGLKSTPYGQVVLIMDTSGVIANAGKGAASIYAVNEFDE